MATSVKTERVQVGPALVLEAEIAKEVDLVKTAIAAGDIDASIAEVEVTAKAAQNPTGKDLFGFYLKLLAQSASGMAALCGGLIRPSVRPVDEKGNTIPEEKRSTEQVEAAKTGACDWFNYGQDLDRKQTCRTSILSAVEGPEKTIRKAFDGMVLAGYSKTEAAELVRNSPKFKGVEGLENLIARVAA